MHALLPFMTADCLYHHTVLYHHHYCYYQHHLHHHHHYYFYYHTVTVSSCRQKRTVAEPEAAYGPPGSTGEENISVVAAPIQPGFKLESLGTAEQAGRRFLETTVASINANREAKLLTAESRSAVLTSLLYVAHCLGCCVSHVTLWQLTVFLMLLCGKLLCGSYCLGCSVPNACVSHIVQPAVCCNPCVGT